MKYTYRLYLGTLPLPYGNLEKVRLLFYEYISALLYKYMF